MQANAKEREKEPAVWGPHVAECVMRGARLQWPYAGSCSFLWDICELFQHYIWVPWVSPFPEVMWRPTTTLIYPACYQCLLYLFLGVSGSEHALLTAVLLRIHWRCQPAPFFFCAETAADLYGHQQLTSTAHSTL